MAQIYSLLFITLLVFGVFGISSIIVNSPKYKFYKPTYDAIKSGTYVFTESSETYSTFRQLSKKDEWWSDDEILFFHRGMTKDSIKLLGCSNYIHAGLINWFDPYTTYWFYKLHSIARTKIFIPIIEQAELSNINLEHEFIKDKSKV